MFFFLTPSPFLDHVQPLGGWTAVNPSQTDIQKAARIAVKEFNTKSKAKKYFKLVDVTSAKTKVNYFSVYWNFFK